MRWGLRPRWYGSEAALLALGRTAINTGRFDTDVPRKFFDCVADVESEMELPAGRHNIYGRADIWPEFQKMYEGYIADTGAIALAVMAGALRMPLSPILPENTMSPANNWKP